MILFKFCLKFGGQFNRWLSQSILFNLLNSKILNSAYNFIDDYSVEVLEAITHLEKNVFIDNRDFFANLLMQIYDDKFSEVATQFRQTICFIDEILYK